MESRLLVNSVTGEVTATLDEGDCIVRRKSREYIQNMRENRIINAHFIKVNEDEGRLILKELSTYEKVVLFTLQHYVSYDSGLICHSNGKEIGFDDVISLTGLSRRTASDALNGLIDLDVIYKGRNSRKVQYFMNPWLANKGISTNGTLKKMFGNYKIRSQGGVRWSDLP